MAGLTICLPMVVCVSAKDTFRLPKELLFKAGGIAIVAVALIAALVSGVPARAARRRDVGVAVAAVLAWSTVSLTASTNWDLSFASMIYVLAAAAFFLATWAGSRSRSVSAVYLAIIPAALNAVIAVLQRSSIWTPVKVEATGRLATTGLIGNPDDLGMYLVAPIVAAAVLATTVRRHRLPAIACALILIAGLIASETLGAIAAVIIGLSLFFVKRRPRTTAVVLLCCILLGAVFIRLSPARWEITRTKIAAAADGDIDPLLSGRLPAFLAAWRMFRDHPVTGVGIGCFKFHYFDQKIAVEKEHPWLMNRSVMNFGEAHNEHLQILAEGGVPAYLMFLAVLALIARVSRTPDDTAGDERKAFSRNVGVPMAAAIFTLALSAFPLRLAAPTQAILFFCGLVLSWRGDESS